MVEGILMGNSVKITERMLQYLQHCPRNKQHLWEWCDDILREKRLIESNTTL